MKKHIYSLLFLALVAFSSCGPAAESREVMHARAKTIADSMANLIRTAMAEAEMPKTAAPPARDTTAKSTNTSVLPPNK